MVAFCPPIVTVRTPVLSGSFDLNVRAILLPFSPNVVSALLVAICIVLSVGLFVSMSTYPLVAAVLIVPVFHPISAYWILRDPVPLVVVPSMMMLPE